MSLPAAMSNPPVVKPKPTAVKSGGGGALFLYVSICHTSVQVVFLSDASESDRTVLFYLIIWMMLSPGTVRITRCSPVEAHSLWRITSRAPESRVVRLPPHPSRIWCNVRLYMKMVWMG
jgi:hypothetical protein